MTEKHLTLIGIGAGNETLLTEKAKSALLQAQIVFGARRLLCSVQEILNSKNASEFARTEELYRADEIASFLSENPEFTKAAVVFSGDTGFFSGAGAFFKESISFFDGWNLEIVNGISSAVYFAAKLQKSWQGWKFLSLHGAKCNFIEEIRKNPACFFILSGAEDVKSLGGKLERAEKNKILSGVKCWLGSDLSYPDEKILQLTPSELKNFEEVKKSTLYVLLVEHEGAKKQSVLPILHDEDFIRLEKIPMTKQEIRQISICALGLSEHSVFYDIGSGTGSVTVEAARIATEGQVYAIDCSEEALLLTQRNVEKFCLENVSCILGEAVKALENRNLPAPTHAFIGGSKGNLVEVCKILLQKNPSVKIVANFVSIEGICEMQSFLKSAENSGMIENIEIRQIAVSRALKAGEFNLMKAQNPVWVVSFSGKE
jgi:precorrin-6Y C5,15-methyltransferase (decarboxylating)